MKALISNEPGGPDTLVLQEVPDPVPAPDQVLVRVKACGINFPDALLIRDLYQIKAPRPFAPGGEICGSVEAVGAMVDGLRVGDMVIGRCGWGGMAQKIALAADRCIRIPADTPVVEAAAFLFAYATAYHALKDCARLAEGETLLVLGAAGGVGCAAVELGRAMGARVLAAVSSKEKLSFALRNGAHDGLVYPSRVEGRDAQKALADRFKALAGAQGVNAVLDPVGGAYTEAAVRALARHGRHLVIGFTAGIPRLPLNLTLLKACEVIGVDWRALTQYEPDRSARNNDELLRLWAEGRIRPAVSEVYPIERGAEAIGRFDERNAIGKIVVRIA